MRRIITAEPKLETIPERHQLPRQTQLPYRDAPGYINCRAFEYGNRSNADFGFCLAGDTLIYSTHQVHGKSDGVTKRRLDDLYTMTQTPHGRSRLKLLRLRCLDEATGTFVAGKVKRIMCSGVKPVFTVTLTDGKTITTTKTHRYLTRDGWMTLEDAVGGLEVTANGTVVYGKSDVELMVNGRPIYQDAEWLREHYITKGLSQAEIAELAGASVHTIRAWIGKHHLQKPLGSWSIGKTPWNKGLRYQSRVPKSADERAAAQQRMTGAGNHRWRGGISSQAIALRRCVNALPLLPPQSQPPRGRLHRGIWPHDW